MNKSHFTVGAKIRALRGLHLISQIELAKAIGVHQSTFSRIENDQLPLSPEIKAAIENYFNVALDIEDGSAFINELTNPNPVALAA